MGWRGNSWIWYQLDKRRDERDGEDSKDMEEWLKMDARQEHKLEEEKSIWGEMDDKESPLDKHNKEESRT